MKVFLPISLDRWRSPIATLLRSVVNANPDWSFVSFSNPISDEDRNEGEIFWAQENITKASFAQAVNTRFDLVHTASLTPKNLSLAFAAKIRSGCAAKFLNTINLEIIPSDEYAWRYYKWSLKLADHYAAVSSVAAAAPLRDAGTRFTRVIPNGYDSEYFDPSKDYSSDLPEQVAALKGEAFGLTVASLEARKHPEWIIDLAKANPEKAFVMAGWIVGEQGKRFVPMIEAVPNIVWLGHIDRREIRALLQAASVFLFPSEREGLPLSVIEALGMGLPVLGQPKTSMPDLVNASQRGRLIDIECSDAMERWSSEIGIHFLDGRDEGARLALAAEIREQYEWQSIGLQYRRLYEEIIEE